ncbi:MAG: HutD family protein [Lysobacter sp.]|nr:HutD family protein [Lysobacter sp.]
MYDRLQLIPAHEYRRERWRNGFGWTREILRSPEAGDDWDWRLSIAEIERDGPFSSFPGIERELVLLHGHGVRLRFDDGEVREVEPPHGRVRFAGERVVSGELIDGTTHDFNLMWRRDRIDAELWHRPLVGSMVLFVEPGEEWVVHVLSGRALAIDAVNRVTASMGDTLVLRAIPQRVRFALEGGGELLVIRLRRAKRTEM